MFNGLKLSIKYMSYSFRSNFHCKMQNFLQTDFTDTQSFGHFPFLKGTYSGSIIYCNYYLTHF